MSRRETLVAYLRDATHLNRTLQVLEWDQEVLMPPAAAGIRAEHMALIAGLAHERNTSDELGALLDAADADDPLVREAKHDFERARRIPTELAQERTQKCALARNAWIDSRKRDDFALFRPHLDGIVDVMRRWAEAIGYDDDPYDALVQDYEPGETAGSLDSILAPVRENSAVLLARILDSGVELDDSLLRRPYAIEKQRELGLFASKAVGFDFSRGRLDETAHPFCSGFSPDDVRLTTRYDENFMFDALYSTLHEVGHGLYEQGLDVAHFGTPLGQSVSMAVHESQSRMIENHVARCRAAWQWLHPHLVRIFPGVSSTSAEDYYRASNVVKPNLIRVDADEVTYDLHIVIRYELERALLAGDLAVADLPGAWNEKYRALLRIDPPSDANGCLQDVHWSAGLFGYFPTYSLGNVYAAQLFAAAESDLGELHPQFAKGEFAPLVAWLREKIHRHGRRLPPRERMQQATGSAPDAQPMIRYLEAKFRDLYAL